MSEQLPATAIERLQPYVEQDWLESMRVVTDSKLPVLLRTGAVTIGSKVFFRRGRYDTVSPRGLALIAHEAIHIGQYREYGLIGFFLRYGWGMVTSGFRHRQHPMEAPLIAEQRRIRAELRRMHEAS